MEIELRDAAVFVYTLGVVVTGAWIGVGGRPDVTPRLLLMAAAVSLVWTIYFNWKLAPQFRPEDGEGDEGESDDSGGPDESEPPDRPSIMDDPEEN